MTDVEIQFVLPARSDEPLCDMLVEITKAIDERDPELTAHGCLGGEHGYGAHWSDDIFTMRPFYWGDCDCGADEREEAFYNTNHHAPDCYQAELSERTMAWEGRNGWDEINRAAFGDTPSFFGHFNEEASFPAPGIVASVWTPRSDPSMAAYDALYRRREKFLDGLYTRLCKKYGKDRHFGCAVHCTCDYRERWRAADVGHRPTCALELPNFRHHASGFEVRWYKYIGRGMETVELPANLTPIFNDCMTAIAAGSRRAKTPQAVECEASQSGGEAVSPTRTPCDPGATDER